MERLRQRENNRNFILAAVGVLLAFSFIEPSKFIFNSWLESGQSAVAAAPKSTATNSHGPLR